MNDRLDMAVRPEWMFQVRSACQTFYCRAALADRFEFEAALEWLQRALPTPASPQEWDAMIDRLKICAVESATHFHQSHHQQAMTKRCSGSPVETALKVWTRPETDPRLMLRQWSRAFLSAFDATHPPPPVEQAAAMLRKFFRNPPTLDALAVQAGTSRSALGRDFRRRYGMSRGEYLTRVRLRWFVTEVRRDQSNAARAAQQAGYESYHNLIAALRKRTGLMPTQVRHLDGTQLSDVLHTRLALSMHRHDGCDQRSKGPDRPSALFSGTLQGSFRAHLQT